MRPLSHVVPSLPSHLYDDTGHRLGGCVLGR